VASTVSDRVFPDHRGKTDWLHPKIPLSLAPRTRFNTAISAERSLATVSLPLNTCKSVAHAAGGSLNDLVLWLCSTALRDYLAQHGSLPRKSLVAAMPVSLREEGNRDLNTQASMVLVELGSQYRDPKRRMKAILDSTARVKESLLQYKNLLPTDYPSLLAPWLVGGVAKAVYKVYSATGLDQRLPMLANLVISNVPGPSVPLYLAGARMVTYHPMSIVVHGMALNITVQSYAGSIDFGIVAASEAAPHLDDLSRALEAAFRSATDTFAPQTAEKPPEAPASTRAARARSRPRPT
jgi:WS/DGAT/MGAT family acyltransferase